MPTALVLCADPGVPTDGPSGASHHLRAIARALVELGFDTTIANLRRWDHRGLCAEPWTGRHHTLAPRDWAGFGYLREVGEHLDGARLVRSCRRALGTFDVVWERFSLGCSRGARLGARHILEVNAPILEERERFSRVRSAAWVRRQQRATLRRAGRVVAVSGWLKRWCERRGATDVKVLANGSDLRWDGAPVLQSTGVVIGFHGSFRPWHGLDRAAAIVDAMPEARMVLVGDGDAPQHGRIERVPASSGAQLVRQIRRFNVAILPYSMAAPAWFCPLKLADYRALGVPVVVPNLGDLPALAGADAAVVSSDAPGEWVTAIRAQVGRSVACRPRPWTQVVREGLGLAADGGSVTLQGDRARMTGSPELLCGHEGETCAEVR